jgi:hypothetical protein
MLKLVAGSLATVIGLASLPFAAGQPDGSRVAHAAEFTDCAKACGQCALACDQCADHCGAMLAEGKKDHLTTLRTCQDCASVCGSAACITAKGGPFSDLICKACADACKRCGDECEKRSSDPVMKKCADECRRCEKACREMLKHVG